MEIQCAFGTRWHQSGRWMWWCQRFPMNWQILNINTKHYVVQSSARLTMANSTSCHEPIGAGWYGKFIGDCHSRCFCFFFSHFLSWSTLAYDAIWYMPRWVLRPTFRPSCIPASQNSISWLLALWKDKVLTCWRKTAETKVLWAPFSFFDVSVAEGALSEDLDYLFFSWIVVLEKTTFHSDRTFSILSVREAFSCWRRVLKLVILHLGAGILCCEFAPKNTAALIWMTMNVLLIVISSCFICRCLVCFGSKEFSPFDASGINWMERCHSKTIANFQMTTSSRLRRRSLTQAMLVLKKLNNNPKRSQRPRQRMRPANPNWNHRWNGHLPRQKL